MTERKFRIDIFRAAAIFLLLFTAMDLALGDVWCGEENGPVAGATLQLVAPSNASGPQQSPDDDCFCCCGHVVFTTPFVLVAVRTNSSLPQVEHQYLPIAPPHLTFPPPRAA